jgi:hemerythrin-like domain-containing protein
MNAVTLLKSDHRKLEALFDRYRSASTGKSGIVLEITRQLSMHMDAEEREVYPVLRTSISDGEQLVNDAVIEHKEARGLLAELERADTGSFDMDSKVATLRRAVDHHVRDEEEEIFPKAEKSLGKNRLDDLGARIAKAKKSAPKRPPSSAVRNSPGASVGGILSAATDRMKNLLTSNERKPASKGKKRPRRAPKRTGSARSVRRAKTTTKSRKLKKRASRS